MNAPIPSPDSAETPPVLIALDGDEVLALEPATAADAPESMDAGLEAELEAELATVAPDDGVAQPSPEPKAEEQADPADAPTAETSAEPEEFTGLVREAIERFDGQILFELDHDPAFGQVAAVQMGDGDARQFAMVIKPDDGGPLRVEPAAESEHPLAAIMQSYAGLVEAWKKAA
jgi:hypothetical protein